MSSIALPQGLAPTVITAIETLQATFDKSEIHVQSDGAGGARLYLEPIEVGPKYMPSSTWLGGHLVAQLPYADIYPLFARGDLARRDGKPLGAGLSSGHAFLNRPAVQISRRSNRKDPSVETAADKFLKVLEWLSRHQGQ